MAKKQTAPIVISISGLSKGEKKKVVKTLTGDVTRDKQFRKTLKNAETPIPKKVAKSAARAAVVATLGAAEEPQEKTALDKYTELVAKFSEARKKYKIKQKKKAKAAKKEGFDPKIGLYVLKKAAKVKLAKKAKPRKPKKGKK